MSTWKKASKTNQKIHRDRQQLRSRSHLGLLEKKKEYKARANHENKKKLIIKSLKKKALNRNPDEFYHHMINSKVIHGIHRDEREEKDHTIEQMKLMQGRDLKYIRIRRIMEKKKIEKLKAQLHFIDKINDIGNSHIFYLNSDKEAENFDIAARLNTHTGLLNRRSNRLRLEQLNKLKLPDLDEESIRKLNQKKNKSYGELQKRIKRETELNIVERKLELTPLLVENTDALSKRVKKRNITSCKCKQERKK